MHDLRATGSGISGARWPAGRTGAAGARRGFWLALGAAAALLLVSLALGQSGHGPGGARTRAEASGHADAGAQPLAASGQNAAVVVARGRAARGCGARPCAATLHRHPHTLPRFAAASARHVPARGLLPAGSCRQGQAGPSGCPVTRRAPGQPLTRSHGAVAPAVTHAPTASSSSPSGSPVAAPQVASGSAPAPAATPGGSATPPPASGPPAPARVQVIAREYSFTLSRPTVPAGEVIIEFLNRGQDAHNMTLVNAPGEAEVDGTFARTEPEHRQDQTLIMRAGTYTLFCSLPGHRAAGMHATLLVQ